MSMTLKDFETEFNLSEEHVLETLKACEISLTKKNYSKAEKELFAQARRLFEENSALSYDDIANRMKEIKAEELQIKIEQKKKSESEQDFESAEYLRRLELEAIQTGFSLGMQQAKIMGKIIPRAAIMKLSQMIANGELKQNFEEIWLQGTSEQLGNDEYWDLQVETMWKEHQVNQLPTSQPPTNLLKSSTESSTSDS